MKMNKLCVLVVGKTFSGITQNLLEHLLHFQGIDGVVRVTSSHESRELLLHDSRIAYTSYNSSFDLLNHDQPGYNTRHIQRKSMDHGTRVAAGLGFTHILKLRSDFLVKSIDVFGLYSKYRLLPQEYGLIFPSWRFRSCKIDMLSSLPDLWVFGSLSAINMLYSMDGIHQNNLHFVSPSVIDEYNSIEWSSLIASSANSHDLVETIYDTHSELYTIWRERLRRSEISLSHDNLYGNYILFADESVRYFWVDPSKNIFILRPKQRLSEHKWWDKKLLAKGIVPTLENPGWNPTKKISFLDKILFKAVLTINYADLILWLSHQLVKSLSKSVQKSI